MSHQSRIKEVISLEIQTLQDLLNRVDDSFDQAVEMLLDAPGKVIVTGMGKSGHIGAKIAATFSSTGTPAIFLHPSEGLHGDLGMVEAGDILLMLSKSGESDEMIALIPSLKQMGRPIITITDNLQSTLAKHSQVVLHTPIAKEACPHNLAPTCSTTAALALGDALAVTLMQEKGFSPKDFALYHPAGRLGKRLLFKVNDMMKQGADLPVVAPTAPFAAVIDAIGKGGVNAVLVAEPDGRLAGLVTGFDLRKAFAAQEDLKSLQAKDLMNPQPIRIQTGTYAVEALELMKNAPHPINLLPVVEGDLARGVITMSDLVRAGL